MASFKWPAMSERSVIGQRISRLDGPDKSSGKAKYNSDRNLQGMLQAVILSSPHAHARIKSIDVSAAKASKGVKAVHFFQNNGAELMYQHQPIVAVAATTEELARDAVRKVKIEYEILPHLVKEQKLADAEKMSRARQAGERVEGDPDEGLKKAEATVDAQYGIPVITHCCLEPHGSVVDHKGSEVNYYPSTQSVSDIPLDLGKSIELPATSVNVIMDHIGGGFGSKFSADEWSVAAAMLSKEAGQPVKLFLDRAQELTIAGTRPSFYARIRMGGNKDGMITSWDSTSWSTAGVGGGGGGNQMPYIFRFPNIRSTHYAVSTNTGSARAWRAPNHPQFSFLTCAAIEDFADKIGMDPLEVFKKNVAMTARPEVYRYQLDKAAEMIGWKQKWTPRSEKKGTVRTGLGIGIATWGGMGHNSTCKATINPDGSTSVEIGTQDLGVGTRTVLAQVAAETYGLKVNDVAVEIGRSKYPQSGGSGGSTTVGGVSASTRKATTAALNQLFEKVAPTLGAQPDQLEAKNGRVQVIGQPAKSMSWNDACKKLGTSKIEATQSFATRNPEGLASLGTGGIQMAEVSVDIETGVVRLLKMVAVQDCGLVINPKLAESQVLGACIMSACAALSEEQIRDQATGRTLNADMEFYKLAGANDIGEIEVHLDQRPEIDSRGVIGLGEPPAVPGVAAIANAASNAAGVRITEVPLTPDRVLAAILGSRKS